MPRNSTPARLSCAPRNRVPIRLWSGTRSALHFLPWPSWHRNSNQTSHSDRTDSEPSECLMPPQTQCRRGELEFVPLKLMPHTRVENNKHNLSVDPLLDGRRSGQEEEAENQQLKFPHAIRFPLSELVVNSDVFLMAWYGFCKQDIIVKLSYHRFDSI